MSCCAHCKATDEHFGHAAARRDLERYRRRGPDPTTRLMLDAIGQVALERGRLLDVGAGIGVIHHELLGTAIARATHVEAASAYLRAAEEEDARRGVEGDVDYVHGDAVGLSDVLPGADLVTLDRVICCYPDWEGLLGATVAKAGRLYAFSVPHDRWYVRIAVAIQNLVYRLRGNHFRTFVHPVGEIDRMLAGGGFRRVALHRTLVWHVALYERRGGSPTETL